MWFSGEVSRVARREDMDRVVVMFGRVRGEEGECKQEEGPVGQMKRPARRRLGVEGWCRRQTRMAMRTPEAP